MNYQEIRVPISKLQTSFEKYRRFPHLLENHRQSDFYKKVKESVEKDGLLNPLILTRDKINHIYDVKIGNNRLFALQEIVPKEKHSTFKVKCILPLNPDVDYKKLRDELYKEWKE